MLYVIDSTYSNERQLTGVLTVLGGGTFNVPVDERPHYKVSPCKVLKELHKT
jgi:hypothetical protein